MMKTTEINDSYLNTKRGTGHLSENHFQANILYQTFKVGILKMNFIYSQTKQF